MIAQVAQQFSVSDCYALWPDSLSLTMTVRTHLIADFEQLFVAQSSTQLLANLVVNVTSPQDSFASYSIAPVACIFLTECRICIYLFLHAFTSPTTSQL